MPNHGHHSFSAAALVAFLSFDELLAALAGVVFLFGALFVLLVARVSSATYHELDRVSVAREYYERTLDAVEQPPLGFRHHALSLRRISG